MVHVAIKPLNHTLQKAAAPLPKEGDSTLAPRDFQQQIPIQPRLKSIPNPFTPASTAPRFTYASQGTENIVADHLGIFRSIIGKVPGSKLPSSIISDQLIGETKMSNLPRGLIASAYAIKRLNAAQAIDDTDGTIESGIDLGLNGVQSVYGVDYIGVRTLTITSACLRASAPAATTITALLGILTLIGNILSPILSICTAGWGAFQSWKAAKLYEEYEKNGKTFAFLESSIYVSPEKVTEMIEKEEESLKILGETSLEKASKGQSIPDEGAYWCASVQEKQLLLSGILQKYFQEYPELPALKEFYFSKISEETFNSLELTLAIGLLLHLRKIQKKNEAKMERMIGNGCLLSIKKAAERGLTERTKSCSPTVKNPALAERTALLTQVDAQYAKKQREYTILKWMGICLLALSVASFFLTGPFGLIAAFTLSTLFALAILAVDIYFQQDAFDGQPGSCDKIFVILNAMGLSLSIAGSIAVFMIFGGGAPLVLGLSLIAGFIGLCIYGYAYHKIQRQQEKWDKKHPSLKDLASRLKWIETIGYGRHKLDSRTLALFKKLPKPVRQAITKEIATHPFETQLYRKWDTQGSFGQKCLECYLNSRGQWDETAVNQLRRAVKKTAKFFWQQWWYANKQEFFLKQALKFEELFEAVQNNDLSRAQKLYQKIQKSDSDVQDKLYENIRNVFKREESTYSLYEAVLLASK